jgi:ABC-type uncharacterized transport system permease subunit
MHDMSIIWLRVAAVLYSLGLVHVLLTVLHRKREGLFRVAIGAFYTGVVLHVVSITELIAVTDRVPANDFYESASLCGLLIALLFLFVYWRYRYEGLAVFTFPLVFLLTLFGELGRPVASWSNPQLRDAWLLVHVVLILLGYAALGLTAVASMLYLVRERQLKRKVPGNISNRLPPLSALDTLMARALSIGFVLITLAVIAGSTWASIEVGTSWIRDPRIVISLLTWALYLVVVFFRITAGWRGRKAAIMVIALVGCSAVTWAAHTGLRTLLSR